jgi:hypothetical protein
MISTDTKTPGRKILPGAVLDFANDYGFEIVCGVPAGAAFGLPINVVTTGVPTPTERL